MCHFCCAGSLGDSSEEIISATDDLLREADILMAEIAEFRRENNSNYNKFIDNKLVYLVIRPEIFHILL